MSLGHSLTESFHIIKLIYFCSMDVTCINRWTWTYAGSLDCLAVCNDKFVWNCGLEYLNFDNIPLYSIIIQSECFAFGGFHICWSFKSWCKEPLLFINEIFFIVVQCIPIIFKQSNFKHVPVPAPVLAVLNASAIR